jgi:DNA-binding transcriptional MerR regulator
MSAVTKDAVLDQFVETGRAARELHVSAEALRAIEARGVIKAIRTVGGRRLFRWGDILRLKAERDVERDAGRLVRRSA